MIEGVTLRAARASDTEALDALRVALWPAGTEAPADDGILEAPGDGTRAVSMLAFDRDGTAVGFAEAALRIDYVNGTDSSPVLFLEGWYVAPGWRGRGVGRALVEAVAAWGRTRGCAEFASDALLDDVASHAAHRACGFAETERVVYFRRALA